MLTEAELRYLRHEALGREQLLKGEQAHDAEVERKLLDRILNARPIPRIAEAH